MCALLSAVGHLIHLSQPGGARKLRLTFTCRSGRRQRGGSTVEGTGAPPATTVRITMSSSPTPNPTDAGHAPVLTRDSLHGGNVDVVDANVDVVNAMYAELLDAEEIAPTALCSYYVDFYLTQALDGGFAQYVFTLPERKEIDGYIRAGLAGMGATASGPVQPQRGRLRLALGRGSRRVPRRGCRAGDRRRRPAGTRRRPAPGAARRRIRTAAGNRGHRRAQRSLAPQPAGPAGPGRGRTRPAHPRARVPDPQPGGTPG